LLYYNIARGIKMKVKFEEGRIIKGAKAEPG